MSCPWSSGKFFVRFLLTEDAQMLIMGKHEVPVASVPVTFLPITKRVPLNFVAALPLLHSVTEGHS